MTIDPDRLRTAIDAPLEYADELGSTNDRARQLATNGADNGTFVVASRQTAGRGRTGNVWASPRGGVWTTTILRPDLPASHVGRLTFAGGVAAAEAVHSVGIEPSLKWPNDLMLDGEKLGGILTEIVVAGVPIAGKPVDEVLPGTDPDEATIDVVLLGAGLNADLSADDLSLDRPVATLRDAVGEVDPTRVAATFHESLMVWTQQVETSTGFESVLDRWRELDATIGNRVRIDVRGGTESIIGTAVDITETGALVVETDQGREIVTEGRCEQLRTPPE